MKFDRILLGLLQWINAISWWREKKIKAKPYERLQTWRLAGRGMLHKVIRPQAMCPHDVGTYIYEPFRYGSATIYDIHLACDRLDGMAVPLRIKGRLRFVTHRITILKAQHWLGADGRYDAEEVFAIDDDLQGQSSRPDFFIPCILHQLALSVSNDREIDWLRELDNAKKYCMKGTYTHTIILPKDGPRSAIAWPIDEGILPVRIKLDGNAPED
jgi:hypothetical protein